MGEIAHEAVSRRPPIPLDTIVARTHTYTYAANVWGLSIVQGLFSVAACQTLALRLATFCIVAHLRGRERRHAVLRQRDQLRAGDGGQLLTHT